jgi:hypothetical protein
VPKARLLLISDPAGRVVTDVSVAPVGRVSETRVAPAGNTSGVLQEPPGPAPAGTMTEVPATLNVKFVPTVTPEPATLQI